ncbi:MAG TPA: carboxymuconolactone decarboxylase family protein, partial [Prolixibacteraceae bacterium]|nr:carboxymuconolactone decarboxylase family protein [Prolixibacteraceae bacterium]
RCEGCIACHVKDALENGATQQEIVETIGVAVVMGGGPSVVYGDKAYKAMKEMM